MIVYERIPILTHAQDKTKLMSAVQLRKTFPLVNARGRGKTERGSVLNVRRLQEPHKILLMKEVKFKIRRRGSSYKNRGLDRKKKSKSPRKQRRTCSGGVQREHLKHNVQDVRKQSDVLHVPRGEIQPEATCTYLS